MNTDHIMRTEEQTAGALADHPMEDNYHALLTTLSFLRQFIELHNDSAIEDPSTPRTKSLARLCRTQVCELKRAVNAYLAAESTET